MEIVEIQLHSGKRINYYACTTLFTLITGDFDGLRNLLQFGYNVNEYKMAMYNSDALFSYHPKFNFSCQDSIKFRVFDTKYQKDSETSLLPNDAEFPSSFLRRSVVHEVIVFLLRYSVTTDVTVRTAMLKGFHLIWRSRPTAYVRMHEILKALREDWIYDECTDRCWEKLLMVCKKYRVLFKSISEGSMAPRSLKHLSRCAVRKRLMETSWCFGISKLEIPENLKSYLWLES